MRRTRALVPALIVLCLFHEPCRLVEGGYKLTTLANFDSSSLYHSGVTLDAQGNLYGTTSIVSQFGPSSGTVFEVVAGTQTISTIASFARTITNFNYPTGGVALDAQGNIYGTTPGGGSSGQGSVFQVAAGTHALSTFGSFNGTNGSNPTGGVTLDAQGNVYGTTSLSGSGVFEVAASTHATSTLANFDAIKTSNPSGLLTMDAQGNLYGMTSGSGNAIPGTVFEVAATTHIISTLVSFNGSTPIGDLTMDAQGNLYGMTAHGGSSNQGTVFELAAGTHAFSTLVDFNGYNGSTPISGVILDAQGDLYFTTNFGPNGSFGYTLFEVSAGTHALSALYSFSNLSFVGGLTMDAQGNIYGVTNSDGLYNSGTVFELVNNAVPEPASVVILGQATILGVALASHARRRRTHPR